MKLLPATAAQQLLLLSVLCYLLALVLPVVPGRAGLALLLYGWRELPARGADARVAFSWLANPLLWLSWAFLLRGRQRTAAALAAAALGLAVAVHFGRFVIGPDGRPHPLPRLGPGYGLWVASLALALVAALRRGAQRRAAPP